MLAENAEHRHKYNKMFDDAKAAYSFEKTPSFTKMIRESAQWVDAHVPAHDNGEIANSGLEGSARSFYSYGSSFIHGYKWMTEYSRGGTVFALIADALAVTLNMVECAVCLFEAASRAPGGARAPGPRGGVRTHAPAGRGMGGRCVLRQHRDVVARVQGSGVYPTAPRAEAGGVAGERRPLGGQGLGAGSSQALACAAHDGRPALDAQIHIVSTL